MIGNSRRCTGFELHVGTGTASGTRPFRPVLVSATPPEAVRKSVNLGWGGGRRPVGVFSRVRLRGLGADCLLTNQSSREAI